MSMRIFSTRRLFDYWSKRLAPKLGWATSGLSVKGRSGVSSLPLGKLLDFVVQHAQVDVMELIGNFILLIIMILVWSSPVWGTFLVFWWIAGGIGKIAEEARQRDQKALYAITKQAHIDAIKAVARAAAGPVPRGGSPSPALPVARHRH